MHGDALEQLALMPSESVQCAITSPPFYSLRDYNAEGQIGLESTLGEWLDALVAVFGELKRVLRSDGTFFLEIGDTYIDKQLAGAPWRLAFALQEAGWFLRSDCIWARQPPNPMPESVTDRPTKAHSYVFLPSKSARYFYDADAIREAASENTHTRYAQARETPKGAAKTAAGEGHAGWDSTTNGYVSHRNARSVWSIPTEPTPFAHFATFPQALVERCIKAGTSEHGACWACRAPWTRVAERSIEGARKTENGNPDAPHGARQTGAIKSHGQVHVKTTGWAPSCECKASSRGRATAAAVPCVVLDPFMGSGTTALVARRLGRHAIGIELNAEYLAIAAKRLSQLSLLA
jgi:DNA modification methylase